MRIRSISTVAFLALGMSAWLTVDSASAQAVRLTVDANRWLLNGSTASNRATTGDGIGVTIGRDRLTGLTHQLLLGYVPQGDFDPGIFVAGVELRRVVIGSEAKAGLYVALGAAVTRVNAQNQERSLRSCTPEVGCMFEGVSHHTGTYPSLRSSVGLRIPITERIAIAPNASLMAVRGKYSASFGEAVYSRIFGSAGVGVVLRL